MSFVVEDLLSYNAPNNSLLGMLLKEGGPLYVEFNVEKKLYSSLVLDRRESITVLKDNEDECSTSPLVSKEVRVIGVMEKQNQGSGFGHLCREIFYIKESGDLPIYEVLLIRGHRHCETDGRKRRKYRQLVLRQHTSGCSERGQGWPVRFRGYGSARAR